MTKKEYYYLPLDNYNQPDGTINTIELTKEEYKKAKQNYGYIYDNYDQALNRAIN